MGYLIGWWSPYHQQTTTASMAAVACKMAKEDETVCVTHAQFARSDLENILKGRLRDELTDRLYAAKGLAGLLLRYRKSPIITSDDVYHCAFEKDFNNVRLLSGINHEYPLHDDEASLYAMLTGPVKESFDYTFVDVAGGVENSLSKNLLRAADLVVVVLSQSARVIEDFVVNGLPVLDTARGDRDFEQNSPEYRDRIPPHVILVGSYNSHARSLKAKNIEEQYGFEPITIPYSVDYMNALNEGRVSSFFIENEKTKKKDDLYEFIHEVEKNADVIRGMLKGKNK